MNDVKAVVVQAVSLGGAPRSHVCKNPLELSDALASEMLRALDLWPILRWIQSSGFYAYWSSCFAPENGAEDVPRPRPCLFMDIGSGGDTLATVLTIEPKI